MVTVNLICQIYYLIILYLYPRNSFKNVCEWHCFRFYIVLGSQPRWLVMQNNLVLWMGHGLVITGAVFVLSSYWVLGFYGTFLGEQDRCCEAKIYNVLELGNSFVLNGYHY